MTRAKFGLLIPLIFCCVICGCAGGGTTGSGGASVRGTVVDQQNQPLSGVTVTVFDQAGQAVASSTSGADGSFDCGQVASDSGSVRFDDSDGSELARTDYMIPSDSSGVVVTVTRKPSGESETEVEYENHHQSGSNGGGSNSGDGSSNDSSGNDGSGDNSDDNSGPGHSSFDDNSSDGDSSDDMTSPPSQGGADDGGGDGSSGNGSSGNGDSEDNSGSGHGDGGGGGNDHHSNSGSGESSKRSR